MKNLYVTYCSGKKKPIKFGVPKYLYNSQRITDFINICESKGYDYAILSAKYGLFFPNEIRENYNVTFKTVMGNCRLVEDEVLLSKEESFKRFGSLVHQVKKCILDLNINRVIFYCSPPLPRRKCYLKVLHAGVDDCPVDHKRWDVIVNHINEMFKEGKGKIKIVTSIQDL